MEVHPVAELFPLIEGAAFDEFVADIRKNGQREKIKLLDGQILDGRNRWRACVKLGIEPCTEELPADTDPVAYSISLNKVRRHLTANQWEMVAGGIANMKQGGDRRSEDFKGPIGPLKESPVSNEEAAARCGVSPRQVKRARAIINNAPKEIAEMAKNGQVSISAAEQVSHMPKDVQEKIAAAGPKAVKRAAANRRRERRSDKPKESPSSSNGKSKKKVGHIRGHEAINALNRLPVADMFRSRYCPLILEAIECLARIPKDEDERKRGFQLVTDWLRRNCEVSDGCQDSQH